MGIVWIVNPNTRTVLVYRKAHDTVRFLHEDDELAGGDVLPGFRCPVRALFPPIKKDAASQGVDPEARS